MDKVSHPLKWTKGELEILKQMWEFNTIAEIAKTLGKRKKQVVQMAYTVRQMNPLALPSKREGYDNLIEQVFGL